LSSCQKIAVAVKNEWLPLTTATLAGDARLIGFMLEALANIHFLDSACQHSFPQQRFSTLHAL
jgi:hypothetical protein